MKEAARRLESVVQELTRSVAERHPHTLTSMSDLALTCCTLCRTAEQMAFNERVSSMRTEDRTPNADGYVTASEWPAKMTRAAI